MENTFAAAFTCCSRALWTRIAPCADRHLGGSLDRRARWRHQLRARRFNLDCAAHRLEKKLAGVERTADVGDRKLVSGETEPAGDCEGAFTELDAGILG